MNIETILNVLGDQNVPRLCLFHSMEKILSKDVYTSGEAYVFNRLLYMAKSVFQSLVRY